MFQLKKVLKELKRVMTIFVFLLQNLTEEFGFVINKLIDVLLFLFKTML